MEQAEHMARECHGAYQSSWQEREQHQQQQQQDSRGSPPGNVSREQACGAGRCEPREYSPVMSSVTPDDSGFCSARYRRRCTPSMGGLLRNFLVSFCLVVVLMGAPPRTAAQTWNTDACECWSDKGRLVRTGMSSSGWQVELVRVWAYRGWG